MTAAATSYDVVVIGAGPAGLSAALNLVRARRRTLVIDSNRPRNAATLRSHGFLTRDGIPPLELRRLGRDEVETYDEGEFAAGIVTSIRADRVALEVEATGIRGAADIVAGARAVLIATGLAETLPAIPSIRAYYGTQLHSCVECDGYEKRGGALALIGESDDLATRALELSQWTDDLVVFTGGIGAVSGQEEATLAARGVRVERRPIRDIEGERAVMTGVRLGDGELVPRDGGFVRPAWAPVLGFADGLGLALDSDGFLAVDGAGRTSVAGVYAAGESTAPGPQQLIIAAGGGAAAATTINRDLLGAS